MYVADGMLGRLLLQSVLVVERLQREPTMTGLTAAASLGDVRVVTAQRPRLVDL